MCQLNVYCIPKSVKKEKVLSLMDKCLGYSVAQCIDSENPIPSLKKEYSFYVSGGMRCDCGSLPCSYQDYDGDLSYQEQCDDILNKERKRLNELKEFMERQDYQEKKRAFDKEYKRLSKEMDKAYSVAQKFEMKKSRQIMEDKSLSDQEKNKKMEEEVYPEVDRLLSKVDQDPRVIEYHKFLSENAIMWDTYALTKKRAKKNKVKEKPIEGEEIIEIELPSFCIYDMIDDLENKNAQKAGEREYAQIREFVDEILLLAPDMKMVCYWQDGDDLRIDGQKTISRKDMKIENFAHLKYCELLSIEK